MPAEIASTGFPAPSRYVDPTKRSWLSFLQEQGRVITALTLREIYTRFGRDNIGFMWIIVEPGLFATGVVILWSVIKHGGHAETPVAPFLLTGYMPLTLYRHISGRLQRCMQANGALLYHRQVTILSLYFSRCLVEFLGTSAAFAFLMFVFYMLGQAEAPSHFPLMLLGWCLYAWYTMAVGFTVGALSERSELVEKFWGVLSYIQIPLSGTFFMVYWLPADYREVMLWVPQVNGVEMIRGGFFGDAVPAYFDVTYLVYVNAILTVIALFLLKDSRRYVEIE